MVKTRSSKKSEVEPEKANVSDDKSMPVGGTSGTSSRTKNPKELLIDLIRRDEGDGLDPKNITPNDCLNRSLTYSAEMFGRGHIIKCEYQNQTWVQIEVPFDEGELLKGQKRPTRKSTCEPLPTLNRITMQGGSCFGSRRLFYYQREGKGPGYPGQVTRESPG
ncbi:unnamed protein product [Allacma fusca]|uniref:Uncharacterized protein n=1 Tax=Allacma fusca TaxID=39272 RepID=A0A8J2J0Z2_9HEXA|nr:unnamed protein product [Allacma fusca]